MSRESKLIVFVAVLASLLEIIDTSIVNVAPEHDDCAAAAAKLSLPVKDVFARALTSASAHLRNAEVAT